MTSGRIVMYTLRVLSLILPTFNEAASIVHLLEVIDSVLQDVPHEIIVVDDNSPDGTWQIATEFSERRSWIKVLRRIGKRGLSSAVIDGFEVAQGDVLAVMDADGQHDSQLLLSLLAAIREGADISIGSRYIPGGSVGDWVVDRRIISRLGTHISNRLSAVPVSDPLSGLFAMKADLFHKIRSQLRPSGFKILLEILAAVPSSARLTEVPLIFRTRLYGQSKLSAQVHLQFLFQALRLTFRKIFRSTSVVGYGIFGVFAVFTLLMVMPRLWHIRGILTDASLRAAVHTTLLEVTKKQGWLMSDIEIVSVSTQSLSIIHRDHLRVSQSERHCQVFLHTSVLACVD